jgi:hypothetical protein
MKDLVERLKEYKINTDIGKRWEDGIEHNQKSLDLMEKIATIDFLYCDDHFCWKYGGDGDNGESLMFLLDIIFDLENAEKGREFV